MSVRRAVDHDSGEDSVQKSQDFTSLIERAMQYSPGSPCGSVHEDLARYLESRGLYNGRYTGFLASFLESSAVWNSGIASATSSAATDRSMEEALLSYVTRFDPSGGPAQEPYRSLLRRARSPTDVALVLAMVFRRGRIARMEPRRAVSMMEDFFTLLRRGDAGSPRSLTFDEGFYAFMDSMHFPGLPPDHLMLGIAYRAHIDEIDRSSQGRLYPLLRDAYRDASDPDEKRGFLMLLEDHVNRRVPDEQLAADLFDLVEMMWRGQGSDSGSSGDGPFAGEDLDHFLGICRTRVSDLFPVLRGEIRRKEAARFCIRYDLSCNGLLPSAESLAKDLESGPTGARLRAAGDLVELDDLAGAAEGSVIRVVRNLLDQAAMTDDSDDDEQKGDRDLLWRYCLVILGNIKASDSGALEVLERSLSADRPRIAETAVDSLAKIGRPAVAGLVQILETPETPAAIHAVEALGKMGPVARDALPVLRQLQQSSDNSDLQDELREGIPFIEFQE